MDENQDRHLVNADVVGGVDSAFGEARPTEIFSRHRRGQDAIEIRPYDFRRPERISKDQMRALQTLHDAFARNFGASLSGFLRTIIEVNVDQAEQMTYSEFLGSLANPTCFSLISGEPLEGQFCLEISPLIIYPIIDRLMGGNTRDLFVPQRPMTMIEMRLVRRILERGMHALVEAWGSIGKFDFQLGEMESNPQLVQIVPPNEVVVVIGFEVRMGERTGTMKLCLPYNVIEPVIEDLNAQNWFVTGRRDEQAARRAVIEQGLSEAPLELKSSWRSLPSPSMNCSRSGSGTSSPLRNPPRSLSWSPWVGAPSSMPSSGRSEGIERFGSASDMASQPPTRPLETLIPRCRGGSSHRIHLLGLLRVVWLMPRAEARFLLQAHP